jgi:hypothetical protein
MINDTEKPAETAATTLTSGAARSKPKAAAARPPRAAAKASTLKPAAAGKSVKRPVVARKPAAAKKPAPMALPAATQKADKPAKAKKVKLVRDRLTMPQAEYAVIALLKKRCLAAGVSAKKSEILRAAVAGLAKLSDASVIAAIRRLDVVKTRRPAKGSKK